METLFSLGCTKSIRSSAAAMFRLILFRVSPFWAHLFYFILLSLFGFITLKLIRPRASSNPFSPPALDLFFTSVSASTVSSMSTVEMEVFSNAQLFIIAVLMLLGGEVFTSMIGLQLRKSKFKKPQDSNPDSIPQIELQIVNQKPSELAIYFGGIATNNSNNLKYNSLNCLCYVVSVYLLVVQVAGSSLVSLYVTLIPRARKVLSSKGIPTQIYSVFMAVSSFANCGFVPTNENMTIFRENSGLLLILLPLVLVGNTLFPFCLRMVIWVLERLTKRVEYAYILNSYGELGYAPLMSALRSSLLAATVVGLIVPQLVVFCAMEWNSEAMVGLNSYQKFVVALFQTTNSRHAGESVVDLSVVSPAILVIFVVMMYLPPYTAFVPIGYRDEALANGTKSKRKWKNSIPDNLKLSDLSYIAIFVTIICITETTKLKGDPLNFSIFNILLEVVSAYGNVGISIGYSCKRRLIPDGNCKDAWYGFAGRWSNGGKFILIIVMFFGRLKKFNMRGGKAWQLA